MRAAEILLAAAALVMAAPSSAELDLGRADVSHLPNGMTVIMLEDHSFPVVSVQMLYKSGSAAEATGKTGLAHFLEHLAFRGSENFPNARATELIYDAGGEWHGYTAMDQTTYFATMPIGGLDLLLKIEADRMARTLIDRASIDAEKGAIITELHSYENDPLSVLQEAVTRTAIQSHPYGSPMAGYVSDVERLTAEDASAYYASHYAPGNAVLAIAGDFSISDAKPLVAQAFAAVPARAVAAPHFTSEIPQAGERRTRLLGPVDRQHFLLAFALPAASNPDFPAYLVVQQLLSGAPGLNPLQSGWSGTRATKGSMLFGATDDIASWLPATRDPFLFMISGSIAPEASQEEAEREIAGRIALLGERPVPRARLDAAKEAVIRALSEDILTTEDAAHQLAYFEGIGALEVLLELPQLVGMVTGEDVQRVARSYLASDKMTVGWMIAGKAPTAHLGAGRAKAASDRSGSASDSVPATSPELRRLSSGLPAIVQRSVISNTATVELLLSAPVKAELPPEDLPGLGAVIRSGRPEDLPDLVSQALAASRGGPPTRESPSQDPATRLQQLLADRMSFRAHGTAEPLAVIVTGKIEPGSAFDILEKKLGNVPAAKLSAARTSYPGRRNSIREQNPKALSQGAIGYVVEGPKPNTRDALAWRMLLYVLSHDYSGRLGRSAITDKGIVYHIYSSVRTDGMRSWATLSTGVDPAKADAMEAELARQLHNLVREPPSAAELEAARNHLLGRTLTEAQSNEELAGKLSREFVETGGLRYREQFRKQLQTITRADLARLAAVLAKGTIVRVDVAEKRDGR
jgi:zinc protease